MRSNGLNLEHGLNVEHDTIAVWNLAQIWSISREYKLKIPRTIWEFRELFKNSENYLIGLDWNALFRVDKIVEKTKY